jgi:hypothetical protein
MGMVSEKDRKMMDQLVRDCVLFGLNEQESLEYIERRSGGIKIARSTFYSVKKRLSHHDSETLDKRLNEHIRVGFAMNHFKYIQSIESLQKILFCSISDETSKPPESRNLFAISRIAANMLLNVQFMRQLNVDSPFVNRMKVEVNKAREYERLAGEKISLKRSDVPESALDFDAAKFFGAPSEALRKENGEIDDTPVVE